MEGSFQGLNATSANTSIYPQQQESFTPYLSRFSYIELLKIINDDTIINGTFIECFIALEVKLGRINIGIDKKEATNYLQGNIKQYVSPLVSVLRTAIARGESIMQVGMLELSETDNDSFANIEKNLAAYRNILYDLSYGDPKNSNSNSTDEIYDTFRGLCYRFQCKYTPELQQNVNQIGMNCEQSGNMTPYNVAMQFVNFINDIMETACLKGVNERMRSLEAKQSLLVASQRATNAEAEKVEDCNFPRLVLHSGAKEYIKEVGKREVEKTLEAFKNLLEKNPDLRFAFPEAKEYIEEVKKAEETIKSFGGEENFSKLCQLSKDITNEQRLRELSKREGDKSKENSQCRL